MDTRFILSFLSELRNNNNREWFEQNKDSYRIAQQDFLELVQRIIDGIGQFDLNIAHLEPRKCVYRIYRDIRFSKDKTPYKTHFGAEMVSGGRKSGLAGYYLHIKPGDSIVAGGVWHPGSENLAKIRQEIDYNAKELKKITSNSVFKKVFGEIKGDKLKRAPKGYSPDHPEMELLKLKDFLAYTTIEDRLVKQSDEYLSTVINHFKILKPLNDYINVAIT